MRMTPNEVGPIPKTWRACAIGHLATKITNGFVGVATPHYSEPGTGVRYLLGTNIRPNRITSEDVTFVSSEFSEKNAKSILSAGDLLTVQSGHIGTTAVVPNEFAGANCHALIITRLDKRKAHPGFVSHYLNSNIGKARLRGLHVGSFVPHINTSELGAFYIPLPPLEEQRRMSAIADTWDEAIGKTERLLANSKQRRQGLVGTLLAHPRYLEAKQRDWSFVDFDEVFERVTRKNNAGDSNVLTISGAQGLVNQRDYFNKSVASQNLAGYTLLQKGEFAYNKSYSSNYPMGAIKPLTRYATGVVSSLYLCFRIRDGVAADADFFRHYFDAGMLNEGLASIAQEGARNHGLLNVGVADFFKLRLHIPGIDAQRRIAIALNMAEREERLIKAQIITLRDEKTALMQQLLTGERRVRVPTPATEAQPA